MAKLMDALHQEHRTLSKLLDILDRELNGDAPADVELLHEVMEYLRTYPDQYHHPKEDLIYQALIRHDQQMSPAIGDLEAEHEELAVLTQELAQVVEQARAAGPADADGLTALGRTFLDYYRQHIAKEERWFFPDAERMLEAREWSELESRVTDATDPIYAGGVSERLRSLVDQPYI